MEEDGTGEKNDWRRGWEVRKKGHENMMAGNKNEQKKRMGRKQE